MIDRRPVQEGLYTTAAARRALAEGLHGCAPDVVVVQMVRCGWAVDLARSAAPRSAVIFDAIDAMGLHFERAAPHVRPWTRPLYRAESGRCRRRERDLASRADVVTAVSKRDLEALSAPPERGRIVPVSGRDMGLAHPRADRPTVLLSGNLGYRPTVAAATWFADQVWPQLVARVPAASWLLVGARPGARIRQLGRLPGVEVHSDVEDLRPYLAQATVAIAPMASGSGVPMKILEAWSAAVPVVADQWAAAGLEPPGAEAVVVADHPDEWVTALHRLLTDPDHAADLGRRGREVWESRYRFDRIAEAVRHVVTEASTLKK